MIDTGIALLTLQQWTIVTYYIVYVYVGSSYVLEFCRESYRVVPYQNFSAIGKFQHDRILFCTHKVMAAKKKKKIGITFNSGYYYSQVPRIVVFYLNNTLETINHNLNNHLNN